MTRDMCGNKRRSRGGVLGVRPSASLRAGYSARIGYRVWSAAADAAYFDGSQDSCVPPRKTPLRGPG